MFYCSFFFFFYYFNECSHGLISVRITLKILLFYFILFFNKTYLTQELIHLIENQFFNKERTHTLFRICLNKSYSIKTSVLINMYAFISKTILLANPLISDSHRNKTRIKLFFLFIFLSYKLIIKFFLYIKIFKIHLTYFFHFFKLLRCDKNLNWTSTINIENLHPSYSKI